MTGQKVGYQRVSTEDQNFDRQLEGLNLDKVFSDKMSGKNTDRPQLQAALEYCREGDQLHIHSIDRMARNLIDLQSIVNGLVDKNVSVHFLKENLVFKGDDDPMSILTLQMMGSFAQFERSLIRQRQREGIKAALKKGVKFGQPPKLSIEQVKEVQALATAGANKTELAKKYDISRQSLYNYIKQQ